MRSIALIQRPKIRVYLHADRNWERNSLLVAVKPFKKVHFAHIDWPWKLAAQLRKVFPFFMYISYFDCDSARYFSGHPYFALNHWHLNRVQARLDYLSDGTSHSRMGTIAWFKAHLELFKTNRRVFHVEDEV